MKVETNTPEKPEVVGIAEKLKLEPEHAFGLLFLVWRWADANSVDGTAVPVSRNFIDRLVRRRGFSAAMEEVGWLRGKDGALEFPGFERHNGNSAKARAESNRRMSRSRAKRNTGCGNVAEPPQQKPQPEKSTVDKSVSKETLPLAAGGADTDLGPFLEMVWSAGPPQTRLRSSRIQLAKAWKALLAKPPPEKVLAALGQWSKSSAWQKDSGQFAPAIHRWVQLRQWENLPEESSTAGTNGHRPPVDIGKRRPFGVLDTTAPAPSGYDPECGF